MPTNRRARTWATARRRRMWTSKGFSPGSLFAGGEEGFFSEISPLTTFTGADIPASVGDSVQSITDSHGSGMDLSATGVDPILRQDESGAHYLEFAGLSGLATLSALDVSSGGLTVAVGVRFTSPLSAWSDIGFTVGGVGAISGLSAPVVGSDYSLISAHDAASATLTINGLANAPTAAISLVNGVVGIGASFSGRLYCAFAIHRRLTPSEITSLDVRIRAAMP